MLPQKKHGRGLLLGKELDAKLQLYLKTVHSNRRPVAARIVMAAAKGLLLTRNRLGLAEYGRHIRVKPSLALCSIQKNEICA